MTNPNKLTGPVPLQVSRFQAPEGNVEAFAVTEGGLLLRDDRGVVYGYGFHSGLTYSPRGGDKTRRAYARIAGLKATDVISACREERRRREAVLKNSRLKKARAYLTANGYKVTAPKGEK